MLILLPPSEGKTAPVHGPVLDLGALLAAGELEHPRREVMRALARASALPEAARVLGLGSRSADEAALNLVLEQAPCVAAHDLFTGVLYDAAGMRRLGADSACRRVLGERVLIASGLWGLLRATDPVPDHRLSMGTTLEGPGRLAAFWKPWLAPVLGEAARGVVVDCRSGAYSPVWQPVPAQDVTLLRVKVVVEKADGTRSVVSHHAKQARGLLAGALVRALAEGAAAQCEDTVEQVQRVAAGLEAVRGVELGPADRAGRRDLVLVLASTGGQEAQSG